MEVYQPRVLPAELIQLAAYYSDTSAEPFRLRAFVQDPFEPKYPEEGHQQRTGLLGEYLWDEGTVDMFLGRLAYTSPFTRKLPPPMGLWFGAVTVLLHEIGHHRQAVELGWESDIDELGYFCSRSERAARQFSLQELHRLAGLDRDLFMPTALGQLGWLGIYAHREIDQAAKHVAEHPVGTWTFSHYLRSVRLRAVHVPTGVFQTFQPKKGGELQYGWRRNRAIDIAEREGIIWQDKRGRRWRYLRLGQMVQTGCLDELANG